MKIYMKKMSSECDPLFYSFNGLHLDKEFHGSFYPKTEFGLIKSQLVYVFEKKMEMEYLPDLEAAKEKIQELLESEIEFVGEENS